MIGLLVQTDLVNNLLYRNICSLDSFNKPKVLFSLIIALFFPFYPLNMLSEMASIHLPEISKLFFKTNKHGLMELARRDA